MLPLATPALLVVTCCASCLCGTALLDHSFSCPIAISSRWPSVAAVYVPLGHHPMAPLDERDHPDGWSGLGALL